MGMVMSFTQVTPDDLHLAMEDPERIDQLLDDLYEADAPHVSLDKAWDGIAFLISAARMRLPLLYMGDKMLDEDRGCVAWSAETVERVAQRLRAAPFDQLAPHFDPRRMTERDVYPSAIWERDDDALDYLRVHYERLVQFFDAAARSGAAAIMTLG
jgi:uncharacterized protein DUF1877